MARRGIVIRQRGDFDAAMDFLKNERKFSKNVADILRKLGEDGLKALREATPKRTGKTAKSWSYQVKSDKGGFSLSFQNDNLFKGVPVVALLVYGHAAPSGKRVEGRDFITPAVDPLFSKLQNEIRKEAAKW